MKVLVVDDEPLARRRLRALLQDEIGAEANVREAESGLQALATIAEDPADVVLLDVRMPTMDGLEAARRLAQLQPAPVVIFTTAYSEHALPAFEVQAADYLLKPVSPERLRRALERARELRRGWLRGQAPQTVRRTHLQLVHAGRRQQVPIAEVHCFQADQKYVAVHWSGGTALTEESLKTLERELYPEFLRIHRGTLVAVRSIRLLERAPAGGHQVRIAGLEHPLHVSRRQLPRVRRRLSRQA